MLDTKALLELIEKNPGVKIIYVDELPDSSNDPCVLKKIEHAKEYCRPECFPPKMQHLAPKPGEIDFSDMDEID